MLRRCSARLKHIPCFGSKDIWAKWSPVPAHGSAGGYLVPVDYSAREPVPKDWVLRGTGTHGPEHADVMKLVLYNRMKQKRPQRDPQSLDLEIMQDSYRLEVAIIWWTFFWLILVGPLNWWGVKYRMVYDHYPWFPKRIDGTLGVGGYYWFLE
mmetsp:Transcript_13182/g.31875  ORF Transcript_13182/g.31875 Transcript_13182/m.31875 type:complete len:153 (+) Transcript_13182:72-530(+)